MKCNRLKKIIWTLASVTAVLIIGCGDSGTVDPENRPDLVNDFRLRTISKPEKHYLYGEIRKDTTLTAAESPYYVIKRVRVLPEITLTIEPGVELYFDQYTDLVVEGSLHAVGTAKQRIKFAHVDNKGDWDGIRFLNKSFDYDSDELVEGHGCIVQYATIMQARTALACVGSSPKLVNNLLTHNDEGIRCWDYSAPEIRSNKFLNNIVAIDCMNYSSPLIINNTIEGVEGKGIKCVNYCSPRIEFNTIFGSGTTWWKGIVLEGASHPIISNNNIYANGGYSVYLTRTVIGDDKPELDAQGNWWGTADKLVISKMIMDKMDKDSLGLVTYNPFVSKKIKNAKANW